ncbi:MAG: polysaccharide deacetylase [Rhizobiales bacterium 32-66-8]|nr:MAG: polysaccharide deacetylase [Rhizobiales bacterium 32-66-8]
MAVPAGAGPVPCAGRADALGTARVLEVPAGVRVGTKSFPQTLPLARGEVVLTFDDGPARGTTAAVLDALKAECVQATFFVIGANARSHPQLVRRIVQDGHTLAHHSRTHPDATLAGLPFDAAVREIEDGMVDDDVAAYGAAGPMPRVPFFRFPGFASTPALLDYLERRGIAVFGADLWASDWNKMTPEQELSLVMSRLEASGGGIVLFHDTKSYTAAMIPACLRALAERGYRVVHVVPAPATPQQRRN